jgi:ATP-binding protein involved in chromosome partitioning
MSYFESNSGEKFNIFGEGGGEALSEKFGLPLLAKIPISEDTNDIADDGTPLILQEKDTPTKTEIEKLITAIAEKLPPIVDETCTGRLAKVFEELSK